MILRSVRFMCLIFNTPCLRRPPRTANSIQPATKTRHAKFTFSDAAAAAVNINCGDLEYFDFVSGRGLRAFHFALVLSVCVTKVANRKHGKKRIKYKYQTG